MRNNLIARRVFDQRTLNLPPELGEPRANQYCGTMEERLIEVAGRTCYDSFGQGRDSLSYHQHIAEVGHGSVWEHINFTVELELARNDLVVFHNRPGVWVTNTYGSRRTRVTCNIRSVMEWDTYTNENCELFYPASGYCSVADNVKNFLEWEAHQIVPMICPLGRTSSLIGKVVTPVYEEEMWISMFMGGSRGFSHEQVRHGDRSAISQRSTRYVDESESDWIIHPLLRDFIEDKEYLEATLPDVDLVTPIDRTMQEARSTYSRVVAALEPWLKSKGESKLNARKQARGAARGFLGNALYTEMIFSASVAQWKRMIKQRASPFADAEIRELYEKFVIPELKGSQYGDLFEVR